MKPQNKVTIFMLVMIVMLSIYYFAMPDKKPIDQGQQTTDQRVSQEFKDLRKAKTEARQTMIDNLYRYIGTEIQPDQAAEALATINELQTLTQNESMLEAELIFAGYIDVFVEANTKNEVRVYIYSETLSALEAIEIIDSAKMRFGTDVNVITRYGYQTN